MRRLALVLMAFSLPVLAADPAPQAQKVEDSPLVAAAKRTKRLGKTPAFVITHETLAQYRSGHVTTTTVQRPVNIPEPQPTPEMKAAKEKADAERIAAAARAEPKAPVRVVVPHDDAEELFGDGEVREAARPKEQAGSTQGAKKP
ncbi:MAG TPA: hypothetical protein VFL80_13040 [Thermoanaerobaculia bacterium]|nr:hypothetical protein [Thermoanaerobaculia bacterium]